MIYSNYLLTGLLRTTYLKRISDGSLLALSSSLHMSPL